MTINNLKEQFYIKGFFSMKLLDKDGNVLDEYEETNQVLNTMYDQLIDSFYTRAHDPFIITELKLGDDVGTGDNDDPEMPTASYTEANQNVVMYFSLPGSANEGNPDYISSSLQYAKNDGKTITYSVLVDGNDVMDQIPLAVDVLYTSATLCTENGKAIVYKRFPFKVVNRLTTISIVWTLQFQPC